MVEIPDSLNSLFTGVVEEEDGRYVVEIPPSEVEREALVPGESYRIGVLDRSDARRDRPATDREGRDRDDHGDRGHREDREDREEDPPRDPDGERTPPVEEGEIRQVAVETTGDQGDGIAKVERGYVVIVPGGSPGDRVTVEIEEVKRNVAFARIVDGRAG